MPTPLNLSHDLNLPPDLNWHESTEESFSTLIGPLLWAHMREPDQRWFIKLTLEDRHLNLGGVCHGGVMMTMVDNAMGSGAYMAGGGKPCATIDMSCKFLAGARKDETLIAVASMNKHTDDVAFLESTIWATNRKTGEDRAVMRANGIWKYLTKFKTA